MRSKRPTAHLHEKRYVTLKKMANYAMQMMTREIRQRPMILMG